MKKKGSFFSRLAGLISRIDSFKASLFLMLFLFIGVFFPFPFDWILLVPGAFFLPGFLFFTLVFEKPSMSEKLMYGVVFSFTFIVLPLMVLVYNFDFVIERELVLQVALAANALFFGAKEVWRRLVE